MSSLIALWSGPRNLSTALMYSFISREDFMVYDEPLFGYFLKTTGVWRPSRNEALEVMETNSQKILQEIFQTKTPTFTKNIANHIVGLNLNFLKPLKNIILTRNPQEVLASYTKQVETPTLLDLAYPQQLEIINFLKNNNLPYLVIESNDLKNDPENTLKKICKFSNIEFSDTMLKWEKGPKKEDGVWAKYWYHSVHQSTGFSKTITNDYLVRDALKKLLTESLELYKKIISKT